MSIQLLVISIIIGLVAALIVVSAMKAQMKSVGFQSGASGYQVGNSLHLTVSQDLFLYQNVSRVARPKDEK